MKMEIIVITVVIVTAILLTPTTYASILGISPQDEAYYKTSSGMLSCKDGDGKFTKSQLNDDYCDCIDGTDEPGTSACRYGRFYCQNVGHMPIFVFSSRVNDGVCDCCDGSDEYDGQVVCENSCWEAGKVAREKLNEKIAIFKEGIRLRKQEVEQVKIAMSKDREELAKLQNEEKLLKPIVAQLKEWKDQIEKEEEREREQKEKEDEERKKAEEKSKDVNGNEFTEDTEVEKPPINEQTVKNDRPVQSIHDQIGALKDPPIDKDVDEKSGELEGKEDHVPKQEIDEHNGHELSLDLDVEEADPPKNTEGLSREELGRAVGSRWTRNFDQDAGQAPVTGEKQLEVNDHLSDSNDDGYVSDTDADVDKDEGADVDDESDQSGEGYDHDDVTESSHDRGFVSEDDISDMTFSSDPSWLEKLKNMARGIVRSMNLFRKPVDKSEASRIHKEYDESSAKLAKLQSRISRLSQKLDHDFGTENAFYLLYGSCFEVKQNKYVYKICPFKQSSQFEGHTTTSLGRWAKLDDSYRVMVFSNGDKCWNGPDRSIKVKLRCGLKNKVMSVDEPSRCEYIALFSTPIVCQEDKLKELEKELELMNKGRPEMHEEL